MRGGEKRTYSIPAYASNAPLGEPGTPRAAHTTCFGGPPLCGWARYRTCRLPVELALIASRRGLVSRARVLVSRPPGPISEPPNMSGERTMPQSVMSVRCSAGVSEDIRCGCLPEPGDVMKPSGSISRSGHEQHAPLPVPPPSLPGAPISDAFASSATLPKLDETFLKSSHTSPETRYLPKVREGVRRRWNKA